MTVAYYHGAPGSYKTASMVRDWLLPALGVQLPGKIASLFFAKPKQGKSPKRHVYTNIRGVASTDYVHVMDNKSIVLSLFIAEKGSLFLIDELGQVFDDYDPKKWHCPDSSLQSDENGTIEVIDTLSVLFDKHRHFGYDIIGTAPSHKRVPAFFQNIAEFGYKHKALASMGLKGFYNQGEHIGTDTGSSSSQFIRLRTLRMSKAVFSYYKSTATGDHKESAITSSFLTHPFILFGVPLIVLTFYYSITSFTFFDRIDNNEPASSASHATRSVSSTPTNARSTDPSSNQIPHVEINTASAYFDRLLSSTQYFVRFAFVGAKSAYFTFGSCSHDIYLSFKRSDASPVSSSSDHPDFKYDFEVRELSFAGKPVRYSMKDCPRSNDSPSIQENLFGDDIEG